MSPSTPRLPATEAATQAARRVFVTAGTRIRDERARRRWTIRALAEKAGLSPAAVHAIEAGEAGSLDSYSRLATALDLRLEIELVDPRRREALTARRTADPVHSAMGEYEVGHLRPFGYGLAVDEPYQHFQFAGRSDVVAWDAAARALLHIENRTRFPDLQEAAGSFNAKRAYLGRVLAQRLGIDGWRSETHVIAALWSAEVLHALRLRSNTFRALCPDGADCFEAWWGGQPPTGGRKSTLIVLDPLAAGRRRAFADLEAALTVRPRYRGYVDAASAMMER